MAKPKRKALSLVTLEGIMTLGAAVVLSHQKMHRERPGFWPVRKFQFNLLEELRSMHFVTYSDYADRIPLDDYPPDNDPRWQERQKLAATVSIQSFAFSWDHLYRFPILGPFLPAKLPWKKDLYDGLQPIADMDADTRAISALSELFEYLAHQIFMEADLDPAPCGDKEEWFAVIVPVFNGFPCSFSGTQAGMVQSQSTLNDRRVLFNIAATFRTPAWARYAAPHVGPRAAFRPTRPGVAECLPSSANRHLGLMFPAQVLGLGWKISWQEM